MKTAVLTATLVIAAAVGLLGGPEGAAADHGNSPNIFKCYEGGPIYVLRDPGCDQGDEAVARNLIAGSPIPVCTEAVIVEDGISPGYAAPVYGQSTMEAVRRWNNEIPGTFKYGGISCPLPSAGSPLIYDAADGSPLVASVIVDRATSMPGSQLTGAAGLSAFETSGRARAASCPLNLEACMVFYNIWNRDGDIDPWYAIVSVTEIIINVHFRGDADLTDGSSNLTGVIAHELGHAIWLRDQDDCVPGMTRIMSRAPGCLSSEVTVHDKADYATIYTPGAVDFVDDAGDDSDDGVGAFRSSTMPQQIRFIWDPHDVHVEFQFEVERYNPRDEQWEHAAGTTVNGSTVLQPFEDAYATTTYRVVSTTEAFSSVVSPAKQSISAFVTVPGAPRRSPARRVRRSTATPA